MRQRCCHFGILIVASSTLLYANAFYLSHHRAETHPSTARYMFDFLDPNKNKKSAAAPMKQPDKTKSPDNQAEDEPDVIEKVFSFFFGPPEESPMGLKRFGKDRFPEQYPATVTEWADPLPGDDAEVSKLRPLLKNTNLETRRLVCAYQASRHGWNANAFHQRVDKKGPSLVVATTVAGQTVGGYNPKGWVGYGEARGSIAAFLFVSKASTSWTKLRKVGGPSLAQLDYPENGPCFGADALVIPLARDNPRLARSKLGSYYERFADGTTSLFGRKQGTAQLSELKVYQGLYEPGEFIPFTDAEPFALY